MKKINLLISLMLIISAGYCQQAASQSTTKSHKQLFIRIFNEKGKKIHKGFLVQTTDSSLFIIEKEKSVQVPVMAISSIRLKRSIGQTVLITALVGGVSMAILGAASADPDALILAYSAGEGAVTGFLLGTGAGAITGGIFGAFRKRPVLMVNQGSRDWIKIRDLLDNY